MKDWSGNEVGNKAAPIKEEQETAMPLGEVRPMYGEGKQIEPINIDEEPHIADSVPEGIHPLKIYHDSHGPNGKEYPLCSECGRRHPVPGGPDSMGAYITLQHVKMGSIRAQEAAALAKKEYGQNPLVVKVFDAYIGAFIEPDQRDSFIEGLLLGLGGLLSLR
jgi:hypothetical protein